MSLGNVPVTGSGLVGERRSARKSALKLEYFFTPIFLPPVVVEAGVEVLQGLSVYEIDEAVAHIALVLCQ